MRHGSPSAYNHGCRCEECTEANRLRCITLRAKLHARTLNGDPGVPHGTAGGYKNWGCRCGQCTDANTIASAEYLAKKEEEKSGVLEEVAVEPVEA